MGKILVVAFVVLAAGCGTRVIERQAETKFKKPSQGTLLHNYEDRCEGRVYLKTFIRRGYTERDMLKRVEEFSMQNRVFIQRNIYRSDGRLLEFVELVICVPNPVCAPDGSVDWEVR